MWGKRLFTGIRKNILILGSPSLPFRMSLVPNPQPGIAQILKPILRIFIAQSQIPLDLLGLAILLRKFMEIRFKDLLEGQNYFSFQETQESLSLKPDEAFLMNPAEIDMLVFRSKDKFTFQGTIKALLEAECARCLTLCQFPLQAEIKFILDQTEVAVAPEIQDDDYQFISKAAPAYNLIPRLREALILSVPMRFLCQSDCKGLCPKCGLNLNLETCNCKPEEIDPRWGKLEQLLNQE